MIAVGMFDDEDPFEAAEAALNRTFDLLIQMELERGQFCGYKEQKETE